MILYDVILVGFPEGPKVGSSEAEALSTVFGIPRQTAERMVAHVPTVVKSGVPEDVCRKYFNAFRYMGAKCDFAVTGENPLVDDVVGTPRLASTDIIAVAAEDVDEDPEFPTSRDTTVSRTDSAPVETVGGGVPESLEPATAETSESLPNPLLRDMLLEQAAAATANHEVATGEPVSTESDGDAPAPRQSATNEAFDLALFVELTPPEISWWQVKSLDLPSSEGEIEEPEPPPPPKASIVDANPAIGGSREPRIRVQPPPDIDSDSWGTASDSTPVDFLARAATTGEPMLTDAVIPRETTGVSAEVRRAEPNDGAGPSVAEIRAAWQAGQDIPLGPTEEGEPPSLGEWDPWMDSELPDADFPSGVAVSDSQGVEDVDEGEGTKLDVPATSWLMAQLDAQRRRQELLGNVAGLMGDDGSDEVVGIRPDDSGAPLFGAPLGAAAVSESGAIAAAEEADEDEPEPEEQPTEVPMAALNFLRRKKKPDSD